MKNISILCYCGLYARCWAASEKTGKQFSNSLELCFFSLNANKHLIIRKQTKPQKYPPLFLNQYTLF